LALTATLAALSLTGCSPPASRHSDAKDVTAGRITLVCASDALRAIERCRDAFERLYPEAHIEVRAATSREAVAALFGARADGAVITRELVPEERRAAVQGRLEIEGYRFARDAAVLVVHPGNPVANVTLDQIRSIYKGEVESWSALGGRPERIVPVVEPPGSDLAEFFAEEALDGEPIRARSVTAASDSEVVAQVARRPGAIGTVSLGGVEPGVKTLKLAALRGLQYYGPDAESVYNGRYPVTRFYSLYVRSRGAALANGFVTFVTSRDGQALVQQTGLVPTSVPVRFVRRSPMLSTHSKGDSTPTP
jgi:phosphate transport system substrate-binding protein